ncbi:Hypothetical protein R9X50_00320500 [Acrodontium crateriforme]|uniref:Zn(2)-C6 fungal-type domain-containing protein n=1 Tax=Acrodontium crateriforme TaxID=150365 RepID=A0AAQ3M347_9PEZI|nr:Hypothetical protein R9X50_00320500 [Acrodontium crateriforme]
MEPFHDGVVSPNNVLFSRRRSTVSSFSQYSASAGSSPERTIDSAMTPYSEPEGDMDTEGCYVVPKIEDMEVMHHRHQRFNSLPSLEESKSIPIVSGGSNISQPEQSGGDQKSTSSTSTPRKPGRPRKLTTASSSSDATTSTATNKKTTRVRSKTGCGTCRRRKKKCDEAKPHCLNCEKNNVVCDGYEPKQLWTSGGRQRSYSARTVQRPISRAFATPNNLPLLIPGVDGPTDQHFFQNFLCHLGTGLCLPDERGANPFLDVIVPMAMAHAGVMHSLLFLSGSCLQANDPNPQAEWGSRTEYHSSQAVRILQADLSASTTCSPSENGSKIKDESIAQTLLLCLQTVGAGDISGTYRFHLNAMKEMLVHQLEDERRSSASPPTLSPHQMDISSPAIRPSAFRSFVLETMLYLDYSSLTTSAQYTPEGRNDDLMAVLLENGSSSNDSWQQGHFVGVMDGLFALMARTRRLRDRIRQCRKSKALAADGSKRSSWPCTVSHTGATVAKIVSMSTPSSPGGRSQAQVFSQPSPTPIQSQPSASYWADSSITSEAFDIDAALRAWTPSAPSSEGSNTRYVASLLYRQCAWLYLRRTVRESRTDDEGSMGVEEGLSYLRAAMGDDSGQQDGALTSTQAVLLLPLFLLGCTAFDAQQRVQISEAFDKMQSSRAMGSIRLARRVVDEVWRLMDEGNEAESWDWEGVCERMGYDFVVA